MEPRKSTVIRIQNGPFDFYQSVATVTALAQALVISWFVSLIYQTWELQLPNSIGRQSGVRYNACLFGAYRLYQYMRPYTHKCQVMGGNGQGNLSLEWEGRISF